MPSVEAGDLEERTYSVIKQVGRIVVNGSNLRVERLDPKTGVFERIGYYETVLLSPRDSYDDRCARKVEQIRCVFERWAARWETLGASDDITVVWRDRRRLGSDLPRFLPTQDENQSGCAIARRGEDTIALIYKKKSGNGAVWVELGER